jgi:hypothetical protein
MGDSLTWFFIGALVGWALKLIAEMFAESLREKEK